MKSTTTTKTSLNTLESSSKQDWSGNDPWRKGSKWGHLYNELAFPLWAPPSHCVLLGTQFKHGVSPAVLKKVRLPTSFINSTSGISAEKPSAGLLSGSQWNPSYRKETNQDNQSLSVSLEQPTRRRVWGQLTCCISSQETASKGDSCCSRACPQYLSPKNHYLKTSP